MIDITVFIVTIIIGIGLIYITNEPTEILIKYPNGEDNIIYVDNKDVCYKYIKTNI